MSYGFEPGVDGNNRQACAKTPPEPPPAGLAARSAACTPDALAESCGDDEPPELLAPDVVDPLVFAPEPELVVPEVPPALELEELAPPVPVVPDVAPDDDPGLDPKVKLDRSCCPTPEFDEPAFCPAWEIVDWLEPAALVDPPSPAEIPPNPDEPVDEE